MVVLFTFTLIAVLLYVFYRDCTSLFLPLPVFFPLAFLWMSLHYWALGIYAVLINSCINLVGVVIALSILGTYAHRKFGYFLNRAMGVGDVIFLFAFALGYPPIVFFGLWCLISLAALIISLLLKQKKVPYAGYLALGIACVMLYDLYFPLDLYPKLFPLE